MIGLLVGYLVGAGVGWILFDSLIGNRLDKHLDLLMMTAFGTGPIGAAVGAAAGAAARPR
jgi:hypothetical protein